MIVMFEYSPPFRTKQKLKQLGKNPRFGTRIIWLWFAVAYYPSLGLNDMMRAMKNMGRKELESEGWRAP